MVHYVYLLYINFVLWLIYHIFSFLSSWFLDWIFGFENSWKYPPHYRRIPYIQQGIAGGFKGLTLTYERLLICFIKRSFGLYLGFNRRLLVFWMVFVIVYIKLWFGFIFYWLKEWLFLLIGICYCFGDGRILRLNWWFLIRIYWWKCGLVVLEGLEGL